MRGVEKTSAHLVREPPGSDPVGPSDLRRLLEATSRALARFEERAREAARSGLLADAAVEALLEETGAIARQLDEIRGRLGPPR